MISKEDFEDLVKDTLANLYDFAALETHPLLFSVIQPPAGSSRSKADYVRQLFLDTIQQLRPLRGEMLMDSPEWRPYLILEKRYVEGMPLKDLAAWLAISDRQMRRDHHRALQALTNLLWNAHFASTAAPEPAEPAEPAPVFEIHKEQLNLVDTIRSVLNMMRGRMDEAGLTLQTQFDHPTLQAFTDRVVLRQLLVRLLNHTLHLQPEELIQVLAYPQEGEALIEINAPQTSLTALPDAQTSLNEMIYWAEQIGCRIEMQAQDHGARCLLWLPRPREKVILVIDDQPPTISLFRRYLSQSDFKIEGITSAAEALPAAARLKPVLITLDVMMPHVDGWEVLQMLKLDAHTSAIPVLICSAWEAPELARSLGAADFLKKPITQKQLLDAIERLDL